MGIKVKKIGCVSVDSGQLMICDPCYIPDEFQSDNEDIKYSNHKIYLHHEDGKLWQYCYSGKYKPYVKNVNSFPGTYSDIIPEYGKSPNQLVELGKFIITEIDPNPYIKEGEFSYRGMSKMNGLKSFGQFNFLNGIEAGVTFQSGYGDDGSYDVYAEIIDDRIIKKIWIDFPVDENN